MKIDVITIFPDMFSPVVNDSILKRAQEKGKVKIAIHDLRDYTQDKHLKVDDRPFGGGPGMVLSAQPLYDAIKKVKGRRSAKVIFMCPTGRPFEQGKARELAQEKNLIFICGRYEGIDERIREMLIDDNISIGDYVLTGGELPAMVVMDAVIRLIPGVLGKEESLLNETFEHNRLDYPQYTRPANFRGKKVPDVLISGNHEEIESWRKEMSDFKTKTLRPDLWNK